MVCIYCHHKTQVTNSRPQKRLNRVWRRRNCQNCGAIFTSTESIDLSGSVGVGSGSHLQPFQRDKLLFSVYDSLRHRKTAQTDATWLTDTIIAKLLPHIKDATIQKQQITQTSLSVLKNFDKPAATHYQAFHL